MKLVVRRRIGMATGIVVGGAIVAALCAPGCEHLHAPGPMNAGHATLECERCHREAPGSVRQQLQSVARTWVGLDDHAADVGFRSVSNRECTSCHDRPNDRHPTSRFLEPRFAEARAAIAPERCDSCHREHEGVRVTIVETTYCRHCHGELVVKQDPLDVPHAELVRDARWETCLGCHDFHGNHAAQPPQRLDEAIPVARIREYFDGGPSPYGAPVLRAEENTP
jgi:hypothetical protein